MKRTIGTAARETTSRIALLALLGLVSGSRLHAADSTFTQTDYPNSQPTEVLGINDQGAELQ